MLTPSSPTSDPAPLINTGVICYFNSLMQALTSSIVIKEKIAANFYQTNSAVPQLSELANFARQQNIFFGSSQECVGECLTLLVEQKKMEQDFAIKYKRKTLCASCGKVSEHPVDINMFVLLYKPTDINAEIKMRITPLADYFCGHCNAKTRGTTTFTLTRVSNVLVVMLDKFAGKYPTQLPEFLTFDGSEKTHKFQLFATIQHYGTTGGGHYTAMCRRNGGVFLCNDSAITSAAFNYSDENIFMAIYCNV